MIALGVTLVYYMSEDTPLSEDLKDAAEILMCSERTLEAWRREEKGPNYYKIEGKILYELEDLYQFIKVSKVSVS